MKKLLAAALLLLAVPAVAQLGVPPSVTSITPRNQTPGVPASAFSFRTGFTAFNPPPSTGFTAFNPPPSIGFTSFGSDVFPVRRDAAFPGGHHRHHPPIVAVPVYYPYYYPAYTQPEPEPTPEPAAYDQPSGNAMDRELWSRAAEREDRSIDRRDAYLAKKDPRYGEHYLDSRETRRRAPDERDEQPATQEPAPVETQLILVLRDGTRLELGNYAIVGQTFIDLSALGRRKKIQLAELDVPATEKANDERGFDFKLPSNPTR